jgi:hypothetical protein
MYEPLARKLTFTAQPIAMPTPPQLYEGYLVHDHYYMPSPFLMDGGQYHQRIFNNGYMAPYHDPYINKQHS